MPEYLKAVAVVTIKPIPGRYPNETRGVQCKVCDQMIGQAMALIVQFKSKFFEVLCNEPGGADQATEQDQSRQGQAGKTACRIIFCLDGIMVPGQGNEIISKQNYQFGRISGLLQLLCCFFEVCEIGHCVGQIRMCGA